MLQPRLFLPCPDLLYWPRDRSILLLWCWLLNTQGCPLPSIKKSLWVNQVQSCLIGFFGVKTVHGPLCFGVPRRWGWILNSWLHWWLADPLQSFGPALLSGGGLLSLLCRIPLLSSPRKQSLMPALCCTKWLSSERPFLSHASLWCPRSCKARNQKRLWGFLELSSYVRICAFLCESSRQR